MSLAIVSVHEGASSCISHGLFVFAKFWRTVDVEPSFYDCNGESMITVYDGSGRCRRRKGAQNEGGRDTKKC